MTILLKNQETIELRQLQDTDLLHLYAYFQQLSAETQSRFAPHSFDWETVKGIECRVDQPIKRFIALRTAHPEIIAYTVLHLGLAPGDLERYQRRGQLIKKKSTASFAPSVADTWQGTGLAVSMNKYIEIIAFDLGIRELVLWGGVQAGNQRAIAFYEKIGYRPMGKFFYAGKENFDMAKTL